MLRHLTIKHIVLIDSVALDFHQGLHVFTGETGAGKSIIMGAIALVLGSRADSGLVRAGEKQATVVAEFDMPKSERITAMMEEQAIEAEDSLIIRRTLSALGKSKTFVNDVPVSLKFLQQLSANLVEIHGQHDQRGLLDSSEHVYYLDAFAGLKAQRNAVADAYVAWKAAEAEFQAFAEKIERARQEEDYLTHVLSELNALAPQEGEEEALITRRKILMESAQLRETYAKLLNELSDQNDIRAMLVSAERQLARLPVEAAKEAEPIVQAAERASIEVNELLDQLEQKLQGFDVGDADIDAVDDRLSALREAARKYRKQVGELPEYHTEVEQLVGSLAEDSATLGKLDQERQALKRHYAEQADALSKARKTQSTALETAIHTQLAELKMEQARVKIVVAPMEEANWSARGMDQVYFEVQTNPGSRFGPLHKIASGGELSRFMLALKVVLNQGAETQIMIFDEVDTGVGGATADSIGRKLAALGTQSQVLCITHLPQVAAYAKHHYYIEKQHDAESTRTQVVELTADARSEELARMLAGGTVTQAARQAAQELLQA